MKKLRYEFIFLFSLIPIIFSCTSNKSNHGVYDYISENIMADAHSVIMEATGSYSTEIKILKTYGETQNPFTGKSYFRDYVSYPYYSIRKVCSALDGVIVRIDLPKDNQGIANYSITVKTDDLEIEYFGYMKINPELAVGDRIEKGTYLATMLGGGDNGMVLNIRMRYKGDVIDPTPFFPSYDNE